jgi:hypothetical protein
VLEKELNQLEKDIKLWSSKRPIIVVWVPGIDFIHSL